MGTDVHRQPTGNPWATQWERDGNAAAPPQGRQLGPSPVPIQRDPFAHRPQGKTREDTNANTHALGDPNFAVIQAFPGAFSAEEADPFLMCDEFGPTVSKGKITDPDRYPVSV